MTGPSIAPMSPSAWVERHLPPAHEGATLLDVACGGGRHLQLALERGYHVSGIDRDIEPARRLAADPRVRLIAFDLERGAPPPFRGQRFDVVLVTNYLHRPLFPDLIGAVAPGGLLIYETYQRGQERHGRPSNPDFLLRSNELLEAVRGQLDVVAFEQGPKHNPNRVVQAIVARRSMPVV